MLTFQGNKLNNELLHMVTLTVLVQQYHMLQQSQGEQSTTVLVLSRTEEKLPEDLQQQAADLRSLKDNLQQAQQESTQLQRRVQASLDRVRQQEQQTASVVRTANERQLRVLNLQHLLQMANQRRESLQRELQQAPATDPLLPQRYQLAEQEVRRLRQELEVAMQLAEEAERKRIEAEQALQQALQQAQEEINNLQQRIAQIEVERQILQEQVKGLQEKRKQQYQHRFQRLLPYVRFHPRALDWFADQTDESILLSAERIIMDMNYSEYPRQGWKRIEGTEFEEVHFAKDYRIYFLVSGHIKYVMAIGHKNSQLQDIGWLRRQKNPLDAFAA